MVMTTSSVNNSIAITAVQQAATGIGDKINSSTTVEHGQEHSDGNNKLKNETEALINGKYGDGNNNK